MPNQIPNYDFLSQLMNPRKTRPRSGGIVTSLSGGGFGMDFDNTSSGGAVKKPSEQRVDFKTKISDILKGGKDSSQKLLDDTLASYHTANADYETKYGGDLSAMEASLKRNRDDYFAHANAGIQQELADQSAEEQQAQLAEMLAADSAIAGGDRASKAMFAVSGGGPSSYADRMAIGVRTAAKGAMAQRIAALKRQNRLAIREQQRALDAGLSDRERSDLATVSGNRLRLVDRLADLDRGDTGFRFTGQGAINDRDFEQQLALERQMQADEINRPDPVFEPQPSYSYNGGVGSQSATRGFSPFQRTRRTGERRFVF